MNADNELDETIGSSRLGSSSVSEILRHLTFFLVQHFSQSELAATAPPFLGPTPSNGLEGILVTKSYLLIARFVEGVCSDRVRPIISCFIVEY
jgi:hypothetical protein